MNSCRRKAQKFMEDHNDLSRCRFTHRDCVNRQNLALRFKFSLFKLKRNNYIDILKAGGTRIWLFLPLNDILSVLKMQIF